MSKKTPAYDGPNIGGSALLSAKILASHRLVARGVQELRLGRKRGGSAAQRAVESVGLAGLPRAKRKNSMLRRAGKL